MTTLARTTATALETPAVRKRRDPVLIVCLAVITVIVLVAIFAPLIAPHSPTIGNILNANEGPSSTYPLGTDSVGRDLLSRLMYGARTSLLGPAFVVLGAMTLGVTIAIASAWIGGVFDTLMSRVVDVLFAFPGLILALLAVAVFGTGLVAPVIALAIAYLPYFARVMRSVALKERQLSYISALYVGGASTWRICTRHLLPNIVPFLVVQAALSFGSAIVDLSALSYIGVGVQPPTPDWGLMVAEGQASILNGTPAESLYAGIVIVITVIAFNLVGDRLSARLQTGATVA